MSFQNIRDFEKIELRVVRTTAVMIQESQAAG